ncbi:hypothetical protein [Nocardioides coralli]|uniref:hypothetical protein n=1 Tax=Nocardioides coralli TaxID=2872154 RepID=UPI001CA3B231|nr:hypothetical protein [Nocardioides coralli]QZY30300.1 hypothetical protein K6T13_06445 [Nocardioides coralli]
MLQWGPEVHMWVLALLVFAVVLALGVWAGGRHATTSLPRTGIPDRVALRDPRSALRGPSDTL